MTSKNNEMLSKLLCSVMDSDRAADALAMITYDSVLSSMGSDHMVSRASFAMALNIALFADLLGRVPSGAHYVAEQAGAGNKVCFDHGALRTICFARGMTGTLPAGYEAFARILEPLGYHIAGLYPLPALNMTGRAYAHLDAPETIPQFFVSELHVERFGSAFEQVAQRVFGTSYDPLGVAAHAALDGFMLHKAVPFDVAFAALPELIAAFGRHHDIPKEADYEALLGFSAEAAWIATEGNAFNHATDRVTDVDTLAAQLRAQGCSIKASVEVSGSGRVRQTAFKADPVLRDFIGVDGAIVQRSVPGSFYEFITRDIDPATGQMDLRFDSSNAQGIFSMTRAA